MSFSTLIELIVAFGGTHAIKAGIVFLAPIDDDIQAIEGPQQPLRFADVGR